MTRYEFERLLNIYGLARLWRSDATGLAAISAGEEYDAAERTVLEPLMLRLRALQN
jgi:hypothetical protein